MGRPHYKALVTIPSPMGWAPGNQQRNPASPLLDIVWLWGKPVKQIVEKSSVDKLFVCGVTAKAAELDSRVCSNAILAAAPIL